MLTELFVDYIVDRMKCRACGLEHDPRVRCEHAKRLTGMQELPTPLLCSPPASPQGAQQPVVPAPIKQVQEFLKRVGRPKIHPDRKTYQKEWMRKRRGK